MRTINLREITFYIINLKKDTDKRDFMIGQMEELGLSYEFVKGVQTKPGTIGIALSHLKALRIAGPNTPFAILEDDCRMLFDQFEMEISVPEQTDAFYLGHSSFGLREKAHEGVRWGGNSLAKYEVFNDQYLQLKGVLARHGVIFLSEGFRRKCMQGNINSLTNFAYSHPGDLTYAALQEEHLVLAPHEPWCYQSEIFRGNWVATRNSVLKTVPLKK